MLEKNTADTEKNTDSDVLQIAIVFFFFLDNWIKLLTKNELIYKNTYCLSFDDILKDAHQLVVSLTKYIQ